MDDDNRRFAVHIVCKRVRKLSTNHNDFFLFIISEFHFFWKLDEGILDFINQYMIKRPQIFGRYVIPWYGCELERIEKILHNKEYDRFDLLKRVEDLRVERYNAETV